MRKLMLCAAFWAASLLPAKAGFQSWTSETEKDPFSGGVRVTVDYSSSLRSGVLIVCDSAEKGLEIRMVPGFAYDSSLEGQFPEIEFAIDGNRLFGQPGVTGSVGDNIAAAITVLTADKAQQFVDAFAAARKQIAIKDGISDRPHLLSARGSTNAGADLIKCMQLQAE